MHATAELDLAYASSLIEAVSLFDHVPHSGRVLVFRTSVADALRVRFLRPELDRLVGRTGRWSFDLEDRDHVLRIETDSATTAEVIRMLRERGEECAELE